MKGSILPAPAKAIVLAGSSDAPVVAEASETLL